MLQTRVVVVWEDGGGVGVVGAWATSEMKANNKA